MSIKQVYVACNGATVFNAATTTYFPINAQLNASVTEANRYHYLRPNGGTFSHMAFYVSANTLDTNGTITLRKNGAGGLNQTVTITAGVTGLFQDTTNSDALSTDDAVNYQWVVSGGTGSATIEFASITLSPSSNFRMYGAEQGAISLTTANVYRHINSNGTSATETDVQQKFRQGGTLSQGEVYLTANTSITNTVLTSRINGADGTIVVTCTALTTGLFRDSTHSDTVASTDLVDWVISGYTALSTVTATFYDVAFTSSDTSLNQLSCATNLSIADGTTRYFPISGTLGAKTTEVLIQTPINFDYTINNLEVYIPTNATTSASTLDLRVGASSSTLSVSITAGTTGYFSDTSHTVTGSSGDLLNCRLVNGGGGALILRQYGMVMGETQAAPTTGRTSRLALLGVS